MITQLGRQLLEKRLAALKVELERTSEERGRAAAEGDLSENSAYLFLGERAEVLRSQIAEITKDLRESIVQPTPTQTSTITFGHLVHLRFESDQHELKMVLVGKNDAHLKPEWISNESPIGLALLDKRVGDTIEVNNQKITILAIEIADLS